MYGNSKYGEAGYSENLLSLEDLKNHTPDLIKHLPKYERDSLLVKLLTDGFSYILGVLNYKIEESKKQLSIDDATYTLEIHERDLGIPTEILRSTTYRKEVIKAKYLSTGTTTKNMIKNVASSFSGAEVDVIENVDDYSFVIKFIGVKGIPQNMGGLIEAIDNIKPAHLSYDFIYTYSWWDNFRNETWNKISNSTWQELKTR